MKEDFERTVDELGRFVIPFELREQLQINENDKIEVIEEGEKIILKKAEPEE